MEGFQFSDRTSSPRFVGWACYKKALTTIMPSLASTSPNPAHPYQLYVDNLKRKSEKNIIRKKSNFIENLNFFEFCFIYPLMFLGFVNRPM